MTIENPIPEPDMLQLEHDDDSGTKRGLLFGKTTSGETIILKVDDNGSPS